MAAAKTERLVNLTLALMAAPRFLTVAEIGRSVEGYGGAGADDGAFRRMFERDKEELRELGIPLETGPVEALWNDELGYRISRRDYGLPEITLDPDEAAALGLAARLWSSAGLADASAAAVRKLAAAGAEPLVPAESLQARVDATEPAFAPMYAAVRARQPVAFGYRRPDGAEATRRLQPWGVVSWRGHWYVAGHDLERDATRVFRLSRVRGAVQPAGPAGSYEVPPGVDVRAAVVDSLPTGPPTTTEAVIRLRPGTGQALRRDATVGPDPSVPGWEVARLPGGDLERLADLVVGYGAAARVLEPAELVTAVRARLAAVSAAQRGPW